MTPLPGTVMLTRFQCNKLYALRDTWVVVSLGESSPYLFMTEGPTYLVSLGLLPLIVERIKIIVYGPMVIVF